MKFCTTFLLLFALFLWILGCDQKTEKSAQTPEAPKTVTTTLPANPPTLPATTAKLEVKIEYCLS